jgi:hypothetical protein
VPLLVEELLSQREMFRPIVDQIGSRWTAGAIRRLLLDEVSTWNY